MGIGTFFNKIGFWGKKHTPELLIASGIISAAAAIATAIYSTTKLNDQLKPYKSFLSRKPRSSSH